MVDTSNIELKVSVIVPVYNAELFLKRCVDSILKQSYSNIEIILVNDGSTDKSGDICDSYSKNNQIIVEHITNCGAGGARNVGLNLATGDYIAFVDSDDWIHPEMVSTMLEAAIKMQVSLVECHLKRVSKPIEYQEIDRNLPIKTESKIESLKRIIQHQRFSSVIRLYRKDLLEDIFFKDNVMSEDVYFTYQIINKIDKLAIVPFTFYYYYANNESVSKSPYSIKKLDTIKSALYIQEEILKKKNDVLNEITRKFVLDILLYNYKGLHYNSKIDPDQKYRRYVRNLMRANHKLVDLFTPHTLARVLPISVYNFLIKLNSVIK